MLTTQIEAVKSLVERLDNLKAIAAKLKADRDDIAVLSVEGLSTVLPKDLVAPMFETAIRQTRDELADKYGVREPPVSPPPVVPVRTGPGIFLNDHPGAEPPAYVAIAGDAADAEIPF